MRTGDDMEPSAWNARPQPTLRTARLVLRPLVPSDAPRVAELAGDRAIADTTATVPHPYPEGPASAWIATHEPAWSAGQNVVFAIVPAGEEALVGVVGLVLDLANERGSLGYWIGVPYWRLGYATEASRAVLDFGFGAIGLNRIEATHMVRNARSGRVMEKLGMAPEVVFRQRFRKWGAFEDVAQRAILRSEWRPASAISRGG